MSKEKAKVNFKKVRGVIVKLLEMVDEDKYCVDIMQQNLAAIGLLKSAHQLLMEGHLNNCFKKAMNTRDQKKERSDDSGDFESN